jgi:hypothetical protein
MKWKNALRDGLPGDNEQVLISADGVYYICIFEEKKGEFRSAEGTRSNYFKADTHVYWTEFRETGEADDTTESELPEAAEE